MKEGKNILRLIIMLSIITVPLESISRKKVIQKELFPDGQEIPEWFRDTAHIDIQQLGKLYRINELGIPMDGKLHTQELQGIIDKASAEGGGVIIIPSGEILSGALFFKPGTHLHLERGAILKGSTDISDFPVMETRMEGQTCMYYPALVNANEVNGFTISGEGIIDGNGLPYWKAFWQRRKWNPNCTNKDEQRPRVLYVSNCRDVQIEGVTLQNSPFWTSHYYKCENLKLLWLHILAPHEPVHAPSSDAVDIDACQNVLVKDCYMSVDDDAIALKGGKGPWADDMSRMPQNGGNVNIIIEDCVFGYCHSCLTCGSESIYDHNILMRRIQAESSSILLHLKMRTDTPQHYEYITVENVTGQTGNMIQVWPWSQFADLEGRTTPPISFANNITMKNIRLKCSTFFHVAEPNPEIFSLKDFMFENMDIESENKEFHKEYVEGFIINNVNIR